jgi:hypothetical protein
MGCRCNERREAIRGAIQGTKTVKETAHYVVKTSIEDAASRIRQLTTRPRKI